MKLKTKWTVAKQCKLGTKTNDVLYIHHQIYSIEPHSATQALKPKLYSTVQNIVHPPKKLLKRMYKLLSDVWVLIQHLLTNSICPTLAGTLTQMAGEGASHIRTSSTMWASDELLFKLSNINFALLQTNRRKGLVLSKQIKYYV